MTIDPQEIWFPAKRRYGWGWGLPTAWQGWLVLATYLALAVVGALVLVRPAQVAAYLVYMGLLSALLVVVCWFKGEKPTWRWGDQ